MNIDTNRSFWHKDDPLIGFIWVHLLSGGRGTHPRDPSLFSHPPLHRHVPLRHPPTIPTQQQRWSWQRQTTAALKTTECVGHRDSLSTCKTAERKQTHKQLWGVLFSGAPAWRRELFPSRETRAVQIFCFFKKSFENITVGRQWCVPGDKFSENEIHMEPPTRKTTGNQWLPLYSGNQRFSWKYSH